MLIAIIVLAGFVVLLMVLVGWCLGDIGVCGSTIIDLQKDVIGLREDFKGLERVYESLDKKVNDRSITLSKLRNEVKKLPVKYGLVPKETGMQWLDAFVGAPPKADINIIEELQLIHDYLKVHPVTKEGKTITKLVKKGKKK